MFLIITGGWLDLVWIYKGVLFVYMHGIFKKLLMSYILNPIVVFYFTLMENDFLDGS